MWDIKLIEGEIVSLRLDLYYLNHVGYKAKGKHSLLIITSEYYLNHVGYKEALLKKRFLKW